MGSLSRLLVLALAVSAVAAKPQNDRWRPTGRLAAPGGRSGGPPSLDQVITTMQEKGCLPEIFTPPTKPNCSAVTGGIADKLQCAANGLGLSTDAGYDQTSAEAFIDTLSEDPEWTSDQKEILSRCYDLKSADLPAENEGAYMLACMGKTMKFECIKETLSDAAEAVDSEIGEDVAEALVNMAEGHCFTKGLKNPDHMASFMTCAKESGLQLRKLKAISKVYKRAMKKGSAAPPTADKIAQVAALLEKANTTVLCFMTAVGEITAAGEIDFAQVTANIDAATGPDALKTAAQAVADFCQAEAAGSVEEYLECWHERSPYACASLMAQMVATGAMPPRGQRKG